MNYKFFIVFLALIYAFFLYGNLRAEEAEAPKPEATSEKPEGEKAEGGEGEHKKKPDEKPRPDSAVSSIKQLPIVRKWQEYISAKNNGSYLDIWGELVKTVNGSKCWDIAVGERDINDEVRIWKRFCIQQTGLEIWVEDPPEDPLEEMKYVPYDKWLSKCKPKYNSPGKC